MLKEFHGLVIDESRTSKLPEYSQYLIKSHYAREGETIQEAMARAALSWGSNLAHSQRLYDYASRSLFMWASPSFSNAVFKGEKPKNMPISCFLPHVGDDVPSLLFQKAEFALLSVIGGGVGQDWSTVRPVSKKAPGPIPFIHENDGGILAWKQGTVRRGALAAYLGVDHPDASEFLKIRTPTGDSERKALNIHHGFNYTDKFMEAVERGDVEFDLIDPSNGKVSGQTDPRQFFSESVTTRARTGEPFMYFIDNANKFLPLPQRMLGLRNRATNLCTEITLAADKKRTPVCCLLSVNAEMMAEIQKEPLFFRDLIEALDNIIEFFINNIESIADNYDDEFDRQFIKMLLSKVKYSAMRERSLGLGIMGFHYWLQRNNIPFCSKEGLDESERIAKYIKDQCHEASCQLGIERGVAPDIQEWIDMCIEQGIEPDPYWINRRNLHLLAIAPNANNSVILATTPSCEPTYSNIYAQEMRIGTFTVRNRYLDKLLTELGKNTQVVWDQIAEDEGSVKNLDFLTDHQKQVFAGMTEMDQHWLVEHAARRQPYICQAQSLNLYFPPGTDVNYAYNVHWYAWKRGLKSLYYYRTETAAKIEKVSERIEREKVEEVKRTIVYGTPTCQQCAAVKTLLGANGIEFEYIDLVEIGKTAAEVTGRSVRSVPQVYINGDYIGGLNDVMKYLASRAETEDEPQESEGCVACEA